MKKKKNNFKLLIILLIIVLDIIVVKLILNSDKGGKDNASDRMSLYDRGLDMISSMNAMAGDDNYRKMIGMPQEVESIINDILAMDYSEPKQVYRVTNLDDIMNLTMYMSGVDENTFEGETKDYVKRKFAGTICNVIMGKSSGAMALAASSCFARQDIFVDSTVTEGTLYIYVYENAYPVFVSFMPGEDGAVLANSSYMILDSMIGADTETAKNSMTLGLMSVEIEEVNR